MSKKIAFLGLGNLGYPIAESLLDAGYELNIWNRTRSKSEPLKAKGAQLAQIPVEAIFADGIVFTVLSDDVAVESIITNDFLEKLGRGIHISMSTISADTSRKLAEKHAKAGSSYVAAPIFARPEAIRAKVGNICLSGESKAKEIAKPIVQTFVKGIFDFGDDPGAANIVKLTGNFMIAASIEMMAEAFTLAEKNGIARQQIYEMLTQTLFAAPIFQNYGKIIAGHQYEPVAFRLPLGLKDISLTLQTAEKSKVPMPIADIVRNRFISALAKNRDNLDWGAMAMGASDDAGL